MERHGTIGLHHDLACAVEGLQSFNLFTVLLEASNTLPSNTLSFDQKLARYTAKDYFTWASYLEDSMGR